MVALGIIYSAGLMLLGLELGLLIGLMAGLAAIVPYMGFIIGIGAALIAGLFHFGGDLYPMLVCAVFVPFQPFHFEHGAGFVVPVLWMGLGVDELSVSVPLIPTIKARVRELEFSACQTLATIRCWRWKPTRRWLASNNSVAVP